MKEKNKRRFSKPLICLVTITFSLIGNFSLTEDYSDSKITEVVMLESANPFPDPKRSGPSVAIIINDVPYIFDSDAGVWQATGSARESTGPLTALKSG